MKFDLGVIPDPIIEKLEKTTTHEGFPNARHTRSGRATRYAFKPDWLFETVADGVRTSNAIGN
ncbi:hypothetical protein ACFPTO_13375 [Paraburkholderia denitrificans]|uniref:Uncharacterized protein n=1 Tax=Paraburkholderia denitrificans TaxID=694025 RepID=A0ABW0J9Y2_9BURK